MLSLPCPEEGKTPVPRLCALRVAARVGRAAVLALHEELTTHPKPGLVSPVDAGSHRDMDASTFFASLLSLRGYFREVARAGACGASFATLRAIAVEAEARMLRATGGANTHRGAIFTVGLLAAGAAGLEAQGTPPDPVLLRAEVRERFGSTLLRELPALPGSHGAIVLRRHGVCGARREAASGFPHVFGVGLPALEESLRRGASRAQAAVQCLMTLVAVLPDTNLLYRGGVSGLRFANDAAREFLGEGGVHQSGWELRARAIHLDFVARNLSPGGSADLLAASLFVHRLACGLADRRAA
jgi:triphosphoribosyl-dephospho-CoA synthase